MTLGLELVANIVDREILFTHRHDQLAHGVPGGGSLRAVADLTEEAFLPIGRVSELVTQDTEGAGGIAEAPRGLG